jgi:Uma2 family endonuclease
VETLIRETILENPASLLPMAIDVHSLSLTDEQFDQLCRDNRDLRFELTAQGELIIMPPTGSLTGWRNAKINHRLTTWAEIDGTGLTFDSSTGFTLPNGAKRSPDAAWISFARWNALGEQDRDRMAHICPDFIVELRSPTDVLSALQDKMAEYLDNGARLGWLLDPMTKRVYIYVPGQPAKQLDDPEAISGEPVLPGFAVCLRDIW